MVYMGDANQETKKDSKAKRTFIDSLEGFLFAFIAYYYGLIGGLIISIPIITTIFLAKIHGDKKIELIAVIVCYIYAILIGVWIIFYIKYFIIPKLLSTAAQNP